MSGASVASGTFLSSKQSPSPSVSCPDLSIIMCRMGSHLRDGAKICNRCMSSWQMDRRGLASGLIREGLGRPDLRSNAYGDELYRDQ